MSNLSIREMVLYKHGVGFFVREGAINAEEIALTFRQDEVNDVLKSLTVFDRAGGQILGIRYETPMDRDARLANSSIRLAHTASVRDLLRDLRGRKVTLAFENTPGTLETVTGRVIGIDQLVTEHTPDPLMVVMVSLLTDDDQVRVYRLGTLRSLHIEDAQSGHDLTYFLDTSMSEDTRRTVAIRLSAGEHQLVLSYVAPSPTWRVSYRIVAEADKDGDQTNKNPNTGKALLQGWGLFDNRLEEDLDNVQVTLVAGQPISFIYELYASRIPVRPKVEDQSRIAPGPIEFEGGGAAWLESVAPSDMPDWLTETGGKDATMVMAAAPQRLAKSRASFRPSEIAKASPPAAEAKEAGEFFQYAVTTPVSVKRGESALVPIIGATVNYSRELLYNGSKLPKHPVAALRFSNTTGLTLERGPVTVVEDSDYKGEAVVPFTKDGNEVYLPYAVELGVRVTERPSTYTQIIGLAIEGAYLIYEEYQITTVTYIIENTTAKVLTIAIEAAILPDYELFDTPVPDVETATDRRWRVSIAARSRIEFSRNERRLARRYEQLTNLNYQNLQYFMDNRWLDQTTLARLRELLDNLALMQRARAERDKLNVERKTLYERQEQLRANLNTLQPSGQEANLRKRMLDQLEVAQNRLEEIDRQIVDLTRQIDDAEARNNQIIAGLE